MSQAKYIEKLKLLSQTKGFSTSLKKFQREYNLPLDFTAVQKDFAVVKSWNDELCKQRREKGLGTNVIKAARTFFLEHTNIFPQTFFTTFFNYLLYGWSAVEEEMLLDGETSKLVILLSFKGKDPKLDAQIFGDTTLRDLDKAVGMLAIIQEGKDAFHMRLPLKRYVRKKKTFSFVEIVEYFPKENDEPPKLLLHIDGNITKAKLRETWKIVKRYQGFLPNHKYYHIANDKKLEELMKILRMQKSNMDRYTQLEKLKRIPDDSFGKNDQNQRELNLLRQKRHIAHKKLRP